MNKFNVVAVGVVVASIALAAPVFAASVSLQNGGLSQSVANSAGFGLGVCNKGTAALTGSVTVVVRANGIVQYPTVGPLSVGACAFVNVTYAAFNMVSGHSYSVEVNVDPQHLYAGNTDTDASYFVTVPGGQVLGASTVSAGTDYASIAAQLAYLASVVKSLQAMVANLHL